MGLSLFAFCIFSSMLYAADADLPQRCGYSDRSHADHVQAIKQGMILGARPQLPYFRDTPDNRFRVHYALNEADGVDSTDTNGNGTPDYVDACLAALTRSWLLEIDTLGYAAPPSDDTTGGSPAIDVYLRNLGRDGYYGITNLDRLLSLTPAERYTTWVEIDNDFSETDSTWSGKQSYSTFGVEALRVTCAHELHHVIQNGSYGFNGQHRMFYELTSTWMEMRAYPEVRDWAVWTAYLLTKPELWPFSKTNALTGYCWGWFGNVLTTATTTDLIKSTWEIVATGKDPFVALNAACNKVGTSFSSMFCTSLSTLYHTGKRGNNSNPLLPHADLLPEIRYFTDINIEPPGELLSANVRAYEVRAFRTNIPSNSTEPISLTQIVAWADADILLTRPDTTLTFTLRFTPSPQADDERIVGSTWGVSTTPQQELCTFRDGIQLLSTEAPYPQPYTLSQHATLYVPVPGSVAGDAVTLQLCDASLRPFTASIATTIDIHEDRLVARLPIDTSIHPGIVFVIASIEGKQALIHKVFIKR